MTVLLPGIQARVVVSGNKIPVILLIADLLADDWELAE